MTTLDLIYKNILIYAIAAVLVVGVAAAVLAARVGIALPPEYILDSVALDQPVSFSVSVLFHNEYLMVTAPIRNRVNHKVGTDVVLFNTAPIRKILQDQDRLGHTGTIFLAMDLDRDIQPLFPSKGLVAKAREVLPGETLIQPTFKADLGPALRSAIN
jgi:hypothetical protein